MNLLYIDPGTGSMLFSVMFGVAGTLVFLGRKIFYRIRFVLTGGKAEKIFRAKIPCIIYSDSRRYWNVFEPICDEAERRKFGVEYWTASADDPAFKKNYQFVKCVFIGEGNRGFARLNIANAKVILSTTPGLDVYQWKRSRNVEKYIHIFHAVDEGLGYRMFGMDFYDEIFLSGAFQEKYLRRIESMRNLPQKKTLVAGCTYLDEMKKRFDAEKSAERKKTLQVLLAPSWGKSAILNRYGEKIIHALISTGYKIVVRPHPQSMTSEKIMMENLMQEFPQTENFSWNFDNDNFSVLSESDILITDFSGIIFDYALIFNRPLIYADTSFDPSCYDAAWLEGEKLWRFGALEKIGVQLQEKDFAKIRDVIDSTIHSTKLLDGIKEVGDEAWQNRGNSAKFVTDYLEECTKNQA